MRQKIQELTSLVVVQIIGELTRVSSDTAPAIGDGTFLQFLLQLLTLLTELLKNLPDGI